MRATLFLGGLLSVTLLAGAAAADGPDGSPPPTPPADAPPVTPPAPAPAPDAAPVAAPLAPPADALPADTKSGLTLSVHVESPVPASLEHRVSPASPWENVCSTPCDTQANPGEEYRVLGTDVAPSKPFLFDGAKGNKLSVKVLPGSIKKARIGLWLLGGGGALAIAGILTFAGGGTMTAYASDGTRQQGRDDAFFAGATMLIAGLGLGAWGAGFWASNSASGVDGPVMAPSAKPAEPLPVPKAAFTFPLVHIDF